MRVLTQDEVSISLHAWNSPLGPRPAHTTQSHSVTALWTKDSGSRSTSKHACNCGRVHTVCCGLKSPLTLHIFTTYNQAQCKAHSSPNTISVQARRFVLCKLCQAARLACPCVRIMSPNLTPCPKSCSIWPWGQKILIEQSRGSGFTQT